MYVFFKKENFFNHRTMLIKRYAVMLSCFLVVASLWIFVLGIKYGGFNISTTGDYNHMLIGPASTGHPLGGLLPPPNLTAYSIWEDPTSLLRFMKPWSILNDYASMLHQAKVIYKNIYDVIIFLTKFNFFWPIILLGYIIIAVRSYSNITDIKFRHYFIVLSCLSVYISGYLLLFVMDRYLMIFWTILLLMAANLVENCTGFFKRLNFNKTARVFVVVILFAPSLLLAYHRFSVNVYKGKDLFDISKEVKEDNVKGRIATDSDYFSGLPIVAMIGASYYGIPSISGSYDDFIEELSKFKINYFFVFNNDFRFERMLRDSYELIGEYGPNKVRVYKIVFN